jgi:opacity protein-like surface antigen
MRFMKLGTLTAIGLLVSATAAYAGDTQRSWNGFYMGGNFGADLSPNEANEGGSPALEPRFTSRPASEPGVPFGSHDGKAPHSGFQAGYNWQSPNSPVVLGIEGDESR